MLPAAQLRGIITGLPATEYRDNLFRAIMPKYLGIPTPISGVGAKVRGGRYTPPSTFETIYFAEDPLAAFHEFHHVNLQLMRDMDDVFVARLAISALLAPQVILEPIRVLDVTLREVRLALGTDLAEVTGPWNLPPGPVPPPTHVLGQETYNSGLFQAIRFPSARRTGGVCVAIFPDRLAPTGSIDLDDSRSGGPTQHIS
jgi:RES domain-containing protein